MMTSVHTFDFLLPDLRQVPFGSLILIAHHKPEERARFLTSLCFAGVDDHEPVGWICLSELPKMATHAIEVHASAIHTNWAEQAARRAIPEPDFLPSQLSALTEEEREAARSAHRALVKKADSKRAKEQQAMLAQLQARWTDSVDAGNLAVTRLPGQSASSLSHQTLARDVSILIVDDISALRRDTKKPPSPKQCGEHARLLKELALEHEMVVCAGMPAPLIHAKEYGHTRESSIGLDDLAHYGSPHEAADIVYTCRPDPPRGYERRLLSHRYK